MLFIRPLVKRRFFCVALSAVFGVIVKRRFFLRCVSVTIHTVKLFSTVFFVVFKRRFGALRQSIG